MASFVVHLSTDDGKCTELFGEPMTAGGIATAIQAAFATYGVVVDQVITKGVATDPDQTGGHVTVTASTE